MRQWSVAKGSTSLDGLELRDVPEPVAGPGEVLVRVRACSLNFRDQAIPLFPINRRGSRTNKSFGRVWNAGSLALNRPVTVPESSSSSSLKPPRNSM